MALFAEFIAPYDPNKQDYSAVLQGPSLSHLLGTDQLGRDVVSQLMAAVNAGRATSRPCERRSERPASASRR